MNRSSERLLLILLGVLIAVAAIVLALILISPSKAVDSPCKAHPERCVSPSPTASPTPTATPIPTPTPPPADCSGYPEPRIFLEAQSWWFQTPGQSGTNFGHLHMGTCFPYNQPVSGTVGFDIVVKLHDNPSTVTVISPKIVTPAGQVQLTEYPESWSCSGSTCTFTQHISIDTTQSPYDGFQELRLFTSANTPNGNQMAVSDGWLLNIRNGKPHNDMWTNHRMESRGWYSTTGYSNALFLSLIPLTPVSGTWSFTYNCNPGGGTPNHPVTSMEARVDPDFHNGVPGLIIDSHSGGGNHTVSFDTSRVAAGPHKLVLMCHTDDPPQGSTLSGLGVIPFVTQ